MTLTSELDLKRRVPLTFALDYDGTTSEDPRLFIEFIKLVKYRGHKIYIVTMRYENEPINRFISDLVDGVLYTGRNAKQAWCEVNGYNINIWIDDRPDYILYGAR